MHEQMLGSGALMSMSRKCPWLLPICFVLTAINSNMVDHERYTLDSNIYRMLLDKFVGDFDSAEHEDKESRLPLSLSPQAVSSSLANLTTESEDKAPPTQT